MTSLNKVIFVIIIKRYSGHFVWCLEVSAADSAQTRITGFGCQVPAPHHPHVPCQSSLS